MTTAEVSIFSVDPGPSVPTSARASGLPNALCFLTYTRRLDGHSRKPEVARTLPDGASTVSRGLLEDRHEACVHFSVLRPLSTVFSMKWTPRAPSYTLGIFLPGADRRGADRRSHVRVHVGKRLDERLRVARGQPRGPPGILAKVFIAPLRYLRRCLGGLKTRWFGSS